MSDLIINAIDHGKFDLEWANHGGIIKVYSLVYKQPNTIHQYEDMSYFGVAKFIDDEPDGTVNVYMLNKRTAENKNTKFLAMATPSECAEAGIEYIEPPARWLPIEVFPPPQYTWLGDEQDKPKIISVDDWEDYEIRNNRSIVCNKSGSVVEAYEWFGKWYHLVNDGGDCYQQLINPTHYMLLPDPPKENK